MNGQLRQGMTGHGRGDSKARRRVLVWAGAIVLLALACGIGVLIAGRGPVRVSCQLNGPVGSRYAGLYESAAGDPGVEVKVIASVRPGRSGQEAIDAVASGSATFGVASFSEIVMAREKGEPLVGIVLLQRENPVCFIARKDSGINKPQDLVGRVVGVRPEIDIAAQYEALLQKLNIDRSRIREVRVGSDMTPFFTGKVDVWPGYLFDAPIAAQDRGLAVNIIRPGDYGLQVFGDTLFTTQSYIRWHRGVVQSFVDAVMAGWEGMLSERYRRTAVRRMVRENPGLHYDHEARVLDASARLFRPAESESGTWQLEGEVWNSMKQWLEPRVAGDKNVLCDAYDEHFERQFELPGVDQWP
jgi:ABC-type nitrate/sulfonate/bicarbonate transport system substrate-binding protein